MANTAGTITVVRSGGITAHWLRVIKRCEHREAQVLKAEGGASVLALAGENGSAGLVVKRWELPTFGSQLKAALKASRAWRHWRGAERLTKAGVRTAACYAIARSRDPKTGALVEWLVMDRLPGETLLRHMHEDRLPVRTQHALAAAVGRAVGAMAAHGVYNRDGKPSNWIVLSPEKAQVAVIDTVAVLRTAPGAPAMRGWVWMHASLLLEPMGCGCPPRLALRARFMKSFVEACPVMQKASEAAKKAMRRRLWAAVTKAVKAHGDPTPKINPLQPPAAQAQ